jgi:hypothetical protein
MSSFDAWLDDQTTLDPAIAELRNLRSSLGQAWPFGTLGWAAYAAAIAGGSAVPDKGRALASLEHAYRQFGATSRSHSVWATIAGWVSNVYFWAVLLGGGVIFFLFSFALDRAMLVELAEPGKARGLITFLFAVATVGIALVIVLAIFLSTGSKEEVSERFRMGKDILAVLIGVFGTIVGFYFGSATASPPQSSDGVSISTEGSGLDD